MMLFPLFFFIVMSRSSQAVFIVVFWLRCFQKNERKQSQRAWNCSNLRAHRQKLHSEFAPSLKVTTGHPEACSSCVDQAVRASAEKKMCFNGGSRCRRTTPSLDTPRCPNQHWWTQHTHTCACVQGCMLPQQTVGCKDNLHTHTHRQPLSDKAERSRFWSSGLLAGSTLRSSPARGKKGGQPWFWTLHSALGRPWLQNKSHQHSVRFQMWD